jgi:HEAT repeat protein
MISYSLLLRVAVIEAVLLAAASGLLVGYAAWHRWASRRSTARLARARVTLSEILERAERYEEGVAELRALPTRLQIRLLFEFAHTLQRAQRLEEVAVALGLVAHAAAQCRSRWWWRRLQGARLLTAVGGGAAAVPALVRDASAVVRAQAAEWIGKHALPRLVDLVIELLDDPVGLVRFAAQDALLRGGGDVVLPLSRYLARAEGRGAEAALRVAIGLADSRFLDSGLALGRRESISTRALAAGLVGAIGGEEATGALLAWLSDPAAEVRAAAAAALGKMGHWPAAPLLAGLLRDVSWPVRREAGLALAAVGPPGTLFLRRALGDEDRFASDMARRVLDIVEVTAPLARR